MVESTVVEIDMESSVKTNDTPVTVASPIKVSAADSGVTVIKSMSKSGRFWKQPKQRASAIKKHKRDSVVKKLREREERKASKDLTNRIKEDLARQQQEKRERTIENKKRKEENARKSEIVQTIKDTRKIKRMKKKQLRMIEKRDTTVVSMEQ